MNNSPCKVNGIDCPNRVLGCHDNCKAYQDYASERERIRNQRIEEIKERDYYRALWKRKRKRRERKK
jgi:hypothetical protein